MLHEEHILTRQRKKHSNKMLGNRSEKINSGLLYHIHHVSYHSWHVFFSLHLNFIENSYWEHASGYRKQRLPWMEFIGFDHPGKKVAHYIHTVFEGIERKVTECRTDRKENEVIAIAIWSSNTTPSTALHPYLPHKCKTGGCLCCSLTRPFLLVIACCYHIIAMLSQWS